MWLKSPTKSTKQHGSPAGLAVPAAVAATADQPVLGTRRRDIFIFSTKGAGVDGTGFLMWPLDL